MTNVEIAEAIKTSDMYELACKTNANIELDEAEKEVVAQLDSHFKEVGRRGTDANNEIAAFVQEVVNREITEAPDELLDALFDRGNISNFDDFENVVDPKNTLIAYETVKGASVPRSYLDITVLTPTWKNRQIETEIKYSDLEKNGWKTVARITEYAMNCFKNTMFKDIFTAIDNGISSGAANYLAVGGATMTQAATDALTLYVNDRAFGEGAMVGYSKYAQQVSKLTGYNSEEMLNEIHRNGVLGVVDGVAVHPISAAKKLGDDSALFIDKRVFGIAGKIGVLKTQGEVKVYEDMNNSKESVHLTFKNFSYGYAFNDTALENVFKCVLS